MEVHRDYVVRGSTSSVTTFCRAVAASPPAGWTSDIERVDFVKGTYFRFTRPKSLHLPEAVVALLEKDGAGEAEVVNIVSTEVSSLSVDDYNKILDEFIAFVEPIALSNDLTTETSSSRQSMTDWLSPEAAVKLRSFSNLANKSTGSSHPMDFERWADFIIHVHRGGNPLDVARLGRCLVEELDWSETMAHDLILQYEFGLALLGKNDES